jgi:hypothetical protein
MSIKGVCSRPMSIATWWETPVSMRGHALEQSRTCAAAKRCLKAAAVSATKAVYARASGEPGAAGSSRSKFTPSVWCVPASSSRACTYESTDTTRSVSMV